MTDLFLPIRRAPARGRQSGSRVFGNALARWPLQTALLLLAALLLRGPRWGDPAIHGDEQFYLLVGDRLLSGALPYVDIWDRKPVGLFLLYAGIRLLGGDGIVQYQIVATLFAGATALVVTRICLRLASAPAALLGGVTYLIWLDIFGGEGGQAPVFYNLLVALAAARVLHILGEPSPSARRLTGLGAGVMLILGVAIQIKYTVIFEGMGFGLILLGRAWRTGMRPAALALRAALWIACALLPTALAFAWFAAIGAAGPFVYANAVSIFARAPPTPGEALGRLGLILRRSWPLLLAAAAMLRPPPAPRDDPAEDASADRAVASRFVAAWTIAALAGLAVFGTYFDHYMLPVLVPLSVAVAPVFDRRDIGLALMAGERRLRLSAGTIILLFGLLTAADVLHRNDSARGDARTIEALVTAIRPHLTGCLFVYEGEPILYHLTRSCLPTRYAFADHLSDRNEDGAIGVDPAAEVRRIMAGRPSVVVSTERPTARTNLRSWAALAGALARDYRPVAAVPVGRDLRIVYARKDEPAAP